MYMLLIPTRMCILAGEKHVRKLIATRVLRTALIQLYYMLITFKNVY